jgi:hypothetical protein
VTLIANKREQAARWRHLALPLTMIAGGLAFVNLATLAWASAAERDDVILGTAMASAALLIWIAYGHTNAAVMRKTDAPDALRWTGLQDGIRQRGSLATDEFRRGDDRSRQLHPLVARHGPCRIMACHMGCRAWRQDLDLHPKEKRPDRSGRF